MKTIICVLVLFAACLFSLAVLAQNPPQVPADHPLDLNGQRQTDDAVNSGQDADILWLGYRLTGVEGQLAAVRSARDSVARARIGKLEDRVKVLEDARARLPTDLVGRAEIQRMIDDAIRAAGGTQTSDPSVDPSAALADLEFKRGLSDLESRLSGQIAKLRAEARAINDRLRGAERQLLRRAIWFDAGGQVGCYSGGSMAGAVGALNWPLGQDGDFVARLSLGVGQGWRTYTDGERRVLGWTSSVDFLYRGETTFLGLGPTLALIGQTAPNGNVLMFPAGGVAGRLGPFRLDLLAGSVSTSTHDESRFGYGATFQFIIPLL